MWGDVLLSSYRVPLLLISVDRNELIKPTQRLHTHWASSIENENKEDTRSSEKVGANKKVEKV
jgi:hypothetical protein